MKYIRTFKENENIRGIYLCKSKLTAETRNGKAYLSLVLQDKTGSIDCKVWEPNSPGIREFEAGDFIDINARVGSYQGAMQVSIDQIRKAEEGEYDARDYYPCSEYDIEDMYKELMDILESIKTPYLKKLLSKIFKEDEGFIAAFKKHSAAKTMHHGFIGGLLEHTLSVTKLCEFYCTRYALLNRDLLLTAAMLHDMGKVYELSAFPTNDYTDQGQLLGHIVIGSEKIGELAKEIPDFPVVAMNQLKHCILAHHGELEYGSPKKPALAEAVALNFADNTDAKLQTMRELFDAAGNVEGSSWIGYNRSFESNIRRTEIQ